jgi:hypothetical protein
VATRLIHSLALVALIGAVSAGGASPALGVVGGTAIQIQAAPWTVFVIATSTSTPYRCTGSIIDASHVLTAAHCLYAGTGTLASPSAVSIKAGVSNFISPTSSDLEQDRSVSSFRVHPGYVSNRTTETPDDVAVLALETPLDLGGPAVQAVALPASNAPFPAGAAVAIAGFGRQIPTVPGNGPLQSMTAVADPQGECGEYTRDGLIANTNGIFLCTLSPSSAPCDGDSGSGVVTASGTPVLIGVLTSSACNSGIDSISVYVGAPEILRFIQGDDDPPTAPRASSSTTTRLSWSVPPTVGGVLRCSTSGWPAPVEVSYAFLNAATEEVLQTGADATYLLPPTAVGTTISCDAAVTDSGGTTIVATGTTAKVEPAPPIRIEFVALPTTKRGQSVTLHVVLKRRAGDTGTVTACVTLPTSVGGRLCRSSRRHAGNALFALSLRIKPTAPLGRARVAISATTGLATARATTLLRIATA